MYLITDNEVVKRTYFRGLSQSFQLHEMILELRKMELDGDLIIHFIWISEKQMIAQGTDGVSRANLSSGVMGDKSS